MSAMLELEALRVTAGGRALVTLPRLDLNPGRPLCLVGETGAGKSLLLQALMGTLPPGLVAEGDVRLDGRVLDADTRRQLWGRRLALLPQEPSRALDPIMRSRGQVTEVHRWVRGLDSGAARDAATRDLERLGLAEAADKLPGELSGGMAQRVAFCAATAGGAGVLLADEPTKGLDPPRRDAVVALLANHAETGCLLVVTHDLEVARRLGGDLAVLRDGVLVEQGPTERLLAEPSHAYTRALVEAHRTPTVPRAPAAPGPPVVSAEGLALARGGRTLLRDIELAVGPGELVGLAGASGIGKSTLGDALLHLLPPERGRVRWAPGLDALRFQKLYQDPPAAFAPEVPLGRLLEELLERHRLAPARLDALLEAFGLASDLLGRPATAVSGGELQRIALARVLLLDPAFLFADEPVSRLDALTGRRVLDLLAAEARERACGVLLVGHDRYALERVCDRVLQLQANRVGAASGLVAA
ncbi:MAG: ATP-binding cassette domain-containing protein [Pseudomonadales bacterium]|jgi:peptide/nickel transport system ATP-binding protein|nr:ATP-binding cassette domain-containing protein [Pseudomonadales bacterium]